MPCQNPAAENLKEKTMLSLLVKKELRAIVYSPKFVITFAVASVLILLSIVVGIEEYRAATKAHDAALQLTDQNLRSTTSWMRLSKDVYRKPDPLQVFVTGTANDIGRTSPISQYETVKLKHSPYADDPIFALFRSIDFAFIVTIVLSLFAVLFTYDAVNGEREGGTLQLTFANPVSRARYIMAKLLGSWLGLAVPLVIPVLLGLLLVLLYRVPLTGEHWWRLMMLGGLSLLLFTFFVALGVLVSCVTRRSSVSFLVSLVVWVALVLIVPRAAAMVAGWIQPVPSIAEVEGERDAFAKDAREKSMQQMLLAWRARNELMSALAGIQRDKFREDHMAAWMAEEEERRSEVEKDIDAYSVRLNEDLRNRRETQQRLAFAFARISPAATYQSAAMTLAGTDVDLKSCYEDAMRTYRTQFIQFTEKKQKETGHTGGFRITVDSQSGVKFSAPREGGALDLSELPTFIVPRTALQDIAGGIMLDAGTLILASFFVFASAVAAFLRIDVR
jgi:ABC-type transport system involved in multi-copper enzyme maturation permease subunit